MVCLVEGVKWGKEGEGIWVRRSGFEVGGWGG